MNFKSLAATIAMLLILGCSTYAQTSLKSLSQYGLSQTLAYGGVAEDLGLDRDQAAQLTGLWTQVEYKLIAKLREYRRNYSPRFSDAEKDALKDELMEAVKEVREFEREQLESVMTQSQIRRLGQIRYQLVARKGGEGLSSLKDDLDITSKQLKTLKELAKERDKEIGKLRSDARAEQLTPNEFSEELKSIEEEFEEKFQEVLTPQQRQTLSSLQGKKFKLRYGAPTGDSEEKEKPDAG